MFIHKYTSWFTVRCTHKTQRWFKTAGKATMECNQTTCYRLETLSFLLQTPNLTFAVFCLRFRLMRDKPTQQHTQSSGWRFAQVYVLVHAWNLFRLYPPSIALEFVHHTLEIIMCTHYSKSFINQIVMKLCILSVNLEPACYTCFATFTFSR